MLGGLSWLSCRFSILFVVPFDVGFHIFTAAVADSNSVSVE